MQEIAIRLHSFQDIQDFVAIATAQSFPVTVGSRGYRVSATSLMGMFSLDYSQPLLVQGDCTDDQWTRFIREVSRFLAP